MNMCEKIEKAYFEKFGEHISEKDMTNLVNVFAEAATKSLKEFHEIVD